MSGRPMIVPHQWNTGLCDCGEDNSSCCDVMWCWHAQMAAQLNKLYFGQSGPNYCCCFVFCCVDVWLVFVPSMICVAVTRGAVRNRYQLDCNADECCKDVCAYCCLCCCCMQCQNHREMSMRGDYPGGCTTEDRYYPRPLPMPTMVSPNVMYTTTVVTSPQVVVTPSYGYTTQAYGSPPQLLVPVQHPQQVAPYPYTPNSSSYPNQGFAQNPSASPNSGHQPYQTYPQQQQQQYPQQYTQQQQQQPYVQQQQQNQMYGQQQMYNQQQQHQYGHQQQQQQPYSAPYGGAVQGVPLA